MIQASIVPVTPFQQNCSILWCEKTKKAAVVDPGATLNASSRRWPSWA